MAEVDSNAIACHFKTEEVSKISQIFDAKILMKVFSPVDSAVVDFRDRWWLLLFLVVFALSSGD